MGGLTREEVKMTHKQRNIPDHSISKSGGRFQELGDSSPDKAAPRPKPPTPFPQPGPAAKVRAEHFGTLTMTQVSLLGETET